jgi:hypothetical protein
LGITEWKEKFHIKRIFLTYSLCALLTASIVTTFTPTASTLNVEYQPLIPGPRSPYTSDGMTDACAGISDTRVPGAYSWQLANGSMFFSMYEKDCPSNRIPSHVLNINSKTPNEYAYVDAGVAVNHTAMGASSHLFRGSVFQKLSEKYGQDLKSTSQCVPVMTSNPVHCIKGGGKLEKFADKKTALVHGLQLWRY